MKKVCFGLFLSIFYCFQPCKCMCKHALAGWNTQQPRKKNACQLEWVRLLMLHHESKWAHNMTNVQNTMHSPWNWSQLLLQEHVFGCVYKRAPVGCLVRMTDAVVRYINPESVFYFTLRHTDEQKCDVILVSSKVQWGSEYWPFEYRKHLNTELFEVLI